MHPLAPRDGERIHCYAKRMLNPFRGIVNVIRYRLAEPITTGAARDDDAAQSAFYIELSPGPSD